MGEGIRSHVPLRVVMLLTAAAGMMLLVAPAAAMGAKSKGKMKPAKSKPVDVITDTTATVLPLIGEAEFLGSLDTEAAGKAKGKTKKERKKATRRRTAAEEECLDGRVVTIIHNGVEIARTLSRSDGSWVVRGPLPPSGDKVSVVVAERRAAGLADCGGDVKDAPVP